MITCLRLPCVSDISLKKNSQKSQNIDLNMNLNIPHQIYPHPDYYTSTIYKSTFILHLHTLHVFEQLSHFRRNISDFILNGSENSIKSRPELEKSNNIPSGT